MEPDLSALRRVEQVSLGRSMTSHQKRLTVVFFVMEYLYMLFGDFDFVFIAGLNLGGDDLVRHIWVLCEPDLCHGEFLSLSVVVRIFE